MDLYYPSTGPGFYGTTKDAMEKYGFQASKFYTEGFHKIYTYDAEKGFTETNGGKVLVFSREEPNTESLRYPYGSLDLRRTFRGNVERYEVESARVRDIGGKRRINRFFSKLQLVKEMPSPAPYDHIKTWIVSVTVVDELLEPFLTIQSAGVSKSVLFYTLNNDSTCWTVEQMKSRILAQREEYLECYGC